MTITSPSWLNAFKVIGHVPFPLTWNVMDLHSDTAVLGMTMQNDGDREPADSLWSHSFRSEIVTQAATTAISADE